MLMHVASLMVIRGFHSIGPILVGLVLMAAGLIGARRGLTPLRRLREKLMAVRMGQNRRVEGSYTSEVQPLIDDLNALLEDREKAVKRALATAGDRSSSRWMTMDQVWLVVSEP